MARFWLLMLLAFASLTPGAAHADDISATGRGVVRIVTIAVVDDQVVGFGHGSGFAVAPNRIVTNAHVVELARRYPQNVVIGVVPSEGPKSYEGKVIAYDAARDLALIEFTGQSLPPAALYSGPVDDGGQVVALGYPGNVDLATARSAVDYIHPLAPIRSEGVFSGRRALSGVEVLLHTASIARGNSGGPLLDPCGRVIGVNSAITQGQDGDANFGFAIADTELAAFLRASNQPFTAVGNPCESIADRVRQDSDADARAAAQAEAAHQAAVAKAQVARDAALEKARDEAQRGRENVIALAAVLLVAGALGIGAAGLFASRGNRPAALWAGAIGGVLVVGAGIVFVLRPSGEVTLPVDAAPIAPVANTAAPSGRLLCTAVPERSRIVSSTAEPVTLDWGASGCMNGRTQYVGSDGKWERVLVPATEQTVSVLKYDPATSTYVSQRYFLGAAQMDAVRALRSQASTKACTSDATAQSTLASQQAAIRAALPSYPNEKIVYSCKAVE